MIEKIVRKGNLKDFSEVEVYYIGKKQFILNKRAIGRKKDLADLEAIGED
jgi:hypothetical protein